MQSDLLPQLQADVAACSDASWLIDMIDTNTGPEGCICSRCWLRVAGLSGASSVCLGTYGAHAFHPADDHYLATFETANKYHFVHSLLIALAPSTRYGSIAFAGHVLNRSVQETRVSYFASGSLCLWGHLQQLESCCSVAGDLALHLYTSHLPRAVEPQVLLCCSLYATALTEDRRNSQLAPTG